MKAAAALLGGVLALAGAGLWWRRHPSACPYAQRFWLELPRPFVTRRRLQAIMAPTAGEHILEVGVGTGYYALEAAVWVRPGGSLDVLDLQQEMLDHTARRARELGLANIEPRRADACALPYPDDRFDAAYLVTVLGEIPDQDTALRELRRVLRPGGRLIVGEVVGDPHMVRFGVLCSRAEGAGFRFERRLGSPLGYFARFAA